MNYLAHSLLSSENSDLIVGNFIADHLKNNELKAIPEKIKKGVLLHRKIDVYTDSHPLFKLSKRYFYNGFEKHSGVLTDIYYDHLLAQNFNKYHSKELLPYSLEIYAILENHKTSLPNSSLQFLNYIKRNNTFFEYSKTEGVNLVLKHLSHRINHGIDLSKSLPLFIENKEYIEKHFSDFMTDMMIFVKGEIEKL